MAFRHDRRRRVHSEDASAGAETGDDANLGASGASALEAYSQAARRQQQPHIVDLVPIGWLGQTMIWLAGLTTIAALELAFLYAPELIPHLGPKSTAALDLAGPASLARWFSSMILGATAGLGMLIYRLRSHRLDDYRGRYRVWRGLVLVAILLSMHETAPLEPLGAAIARLFGRWTGLEDPRWWTLGVATCWGLLTVRTLFETRRSVLASLTLVIAAVALIAGPFAAGSLAPELNAAQSVMLTSGLRLVGHLFLLSAVALYARHVILDAEGLVKSRGRKSSRAANSKRRVKTKGSAETDTKAAASSADSQAKPRITTGPPRTDLDNGKTSAPARSLPASRPDLAQRQPPRPHSPERDQDRDEDDDDESGGLTRAERKKLKRRRRQAS